MLFISFLILYVDAPYRTVVYFGICIWMGVWIMLILCFIALRTVKDPVDESTYMVPSVRDHTPDDPGGRTVTNIIMKKNKIPFITTLLLIKFRNLIFTLIRKEVV